MDIDDDHHQADLPYLSPKDRILKRLAAVNVSEESMEHIQHGLIAFVKNNNDQLPEIVGAILPTDAEMEAAMEVDADLNAEDLIHESMV
ncbi:hypothetical protein Tco_0181071, partial [Tanacetum coccineum]